MSSGKIVQIIGAVVDVEFSRADLPKVYDALNVEGKNLVLEVQQQLGDGVVRTIAMGSTDGLSRGLQVTNTNAPISVPVGKETLGRIMNVLGEPIDEKGPIGEQVKCKCTRQHLSIFQFKRHTVGVLHGGFCKFIGASFHKKRGGHSTGQIQTLIQLRSRGGARWQTTNPEKKRAIRRKHGGSQRDHHGQRRHKPGNASLKEQA